MKIFFLDLRKIYALIFGVLGIFVIISLVSYDAFDPSFNFISSYLPNNIFGYYGSFLSDILIQVLGIGSYLLGLFLIQISYVYFKGYLVRLVILRILSMIICCMAFSMLIGLFYTNYTGSILILINKSLNLNDISIIYKLPILSIIFFISCLFSFPQSLIIVNRLKHALKKLMLVRSDKNSNIQSKSSIFSSLTQEHYGKANTDNEGVSNDNRSIGKDLKRGFLTSKVLQEEQSSSFQIPSTDLLNKTANQSAKLESQEQLRQNAQELLNVLNDFGVTGNIINIHQGPVVTLYEFEPSSGTKSSRVIGLSDDIARSLCAISTRISTVPGRNVLGIEIPNKHRMFFNIRELLETKEYNNRDLILPIILGKDLNGMPYVVDLAKMPHLLVAGTTGSGKSVAINTMIFSLLFRYTPEECKFIMIDPKMLELSVYDDIPHLLTPVVTEPSKAIIALKWAVKEMENRYRMMSNIGVRNISGFNTKIEEALRNDTIPSRTVQIGFDKETGDPIYQNIPIAKEKLPFIVVIVDEMADLMLVAGKDIEASVQRLAQMARAAGIHIIMATQRPSVDVITGVIKANFPSRVSFKVTSKIDSRTILGQMGSEQLLGMGDMLYMGNASQITRVHGPFVDDKEVEVVTTFWKKQGKPTYVTSVVESTDDETDLDVAIAIDGEDDNSLYKQAVQIIKRERKVSTSYIQRSLRIGYNRAAIIIERMEKEGLISPQNHTGKREILIPE